MLRTLVGDFSGLIDLWERDRCPKTLSQQSLSWGDSERDKENAGE